MIGRIPVLFFCGDRSPYGLAHLEPVVQHFDVRALVIADEARWRHFLDRLRPPSEEPVRTSLRWRRKIRDLLRGPARMRAAAAHEARLRAAGAPIHVVHDANDPALLERLRPLGAELVISAAYPQIFRKALLELAPRGAINFHPSPLPRCRGAHPHYWCLATGESEGGVSAHVMTERIDDGDIVARRTFPLDGLYYADLYRKIREETPALVAEVADFLTRPGARPIPQDPARATTFRNDREIHHRLDWTSMPAVDLHNRIRAGQALCTFRGHRTVLTRAVVETANRHMLNGVRAQAGLIVDIDRRGLWVAACDGRFLVIEALEGRRRIEDFRTWAAERNVRIGERFD